MSITSAELKIYKAATINDTAANGGKMSSNQATSGIKNAILPDVTQAERNAGLTRYRKVFFKNANSSNLVLYNGEIHFTKYTQGEDYVVMFAGTQTNTQGNITGSERVFGAAPLNANVNAGESSLVANVEHLNVNDMFVDGDKVFIGTGVSGSDTYEYGTISGEVVVSGELCTINLNSQLSNSYVTTTANVASVYEYGDVEPSFDNWNETAAGDGTYDESGSPPTLTNIGTIEETWTVEFTGATTFNVSGAAVGSIGSGNTSSDFSYTNPNVGGKYFTLLAAGWSGTWASGDTITFKTHPASVPVWLKQVVPAGAASQSGNTFKINFAGESA